MNLYSRREFRLHEKVLIVLTLALGYLLGLTGCSLTRKNTQGMREAKEPEQEFRPGWLAGCQGLLWSENDHWNLRVIDLLESGHHLTIRFPKNPGRTRRGDAQVAILPSAANSGSHAQSVTLVMLTGVFDGNSEVINRETHFSQDLGLPTQLVLGLHVEKRGPGPEVMTCTLGYKPGPGDRYVTAAGAVELPWMARSRAGMVGRALLYPVTVPVDAAAFPVENGAAVLMMPRR
ncbi:hypothetical protein GCM10023213_34270 [Prosthecobacter algae]|uniref:Uncharacterized protein n=1 Tax=Prosthecobacter algae TaxID=1144682 RepID=A0ABP9PCD4_9BACT